MTAPDSRDSVERVVAEMRAHVKRNGVFAAGGITEQWADRLQALVRGPQQAGGEDGEVLCHKLHTSDGKKAWRWVDGPPNEQARDDARNFGWELELAYSAEYVAALQAEVARLREARDLFRAAFVQWRNLGGVETGQARACDAALNGGQDDAT